MVEQKLFDDYVVFCHKPNKGPSAKFEYSHLVQTIDAFYLKKCCALIRDLQYTADVVKRTWIDNYVRPFDTWIGVVVDRLTFGGHKYIGTFDLSNWENCVEVWRALILARSVSARTKQKQIYCANNLLGRMASAGLLPKRFEMEQLTTGKRICKPPKNSSRSSPQQAVELPEVTELQVFVAAHNRQAPFCYTKFGEVAPHFLRSAVPILQRLYSDGVEGRAKLYHQVMNSLFSFLCIQKDAGQNSAFYGALAGANFRGIDSLSWENRLYEWREHYLSFVPENRKPAGILRKHEFIAAMNRLLSAISKAGLMPRVKLKGIKNAKARAGAPGRRSLAQLQAPNARAEDNSDAVCSTPTATHCYGTEASVTLVTARISDQGRKCLPQQHRVGSAISSAEQREVVERLARYFDDNDKPEAIEFISALCTHLSPELVRSFNLEQLAKEISKLNSERLSLIRICAAKDFRKWHEHWLVGQSAMRSADLSPEQLVELLDNEMRSVSERRKYAERFLSGNSERVLGNTLNLLIGAVNGNSSGHDGRYHHMRRRWGGGARLHAYLHPHKRATLALWVLLLVDTGANCEVVRQMPANCLTKTQDGTHMTISFGLKARAGDKRIVDCLPCKAEPGELLSAVEAIQQYLEMSSRYRAKASDETADLLLLDSRSDVVIGVTEFSARDAFKAFLLDHPELAGLNARPSTIRPSVLLRLQHESPEALMDIAQTQADHRSASTTQVYTLKPHTRLVYSNLMRRFTRLYQAVIIASIDGAAEKLGISEAEAARLFTEASRSGLGIACLNPTAGVQPGTSIGENCTRLDACPDCEMRYLVGTVDNIADLILFEEYLRSQEDVAMQVNAASWEKRWLPWLALAEVALAKFAQGETAAAYVRAKKLADLRRADYKPFVVI